ncbi:MAG: pirin family protein, partial [Chloroflexi bacterium]|nr:pirin family protein [Chloroflexota bacterium]
RRSFGPSRANPFDPFLLFDHFAFNDPRDSPIVGFPMHPHRGIETVTYMLEGNVRHRDSLGNLGVIEPGDVQWMTSGRGILHEELPTRSPNGRVDGFQLWVNLPAAQKMSQPRYQEVIAENIPAVEKNGARVRVVAGKFDGVTGPVTEIAAQPIYFDVTLEPNAEFFLPTPLHHTAVAYLFEGEAIFGEENDLPRDPFRAVRLIAFGEGENVRVRAGSNAPARFMLIAGAPIHEPIFPYGPFVMNTEEEIRQALLDLRNGTFVTHSRREENTT